MERRIRQWAGQPLRELRGLGRAERAFFEAMASDGEAASPVWSELALNEGYSDQSHLCRDSRRITGYSPVQLAKNQPCPRRVLRSQVLPAQGAFFPNRSSVSTKAWAAMVGREALRRMTLTVDGGSSSRRGSALRPWRANSLLASDAANTLR